MYDGQLWFRLWSVARWHAEIMQKELKKMNYAFFNISERNCVQKWDPFNITKWFWQMRLQNTIDNPFHNIHCISPVLLIFCTRQCHCGALCKISKRLDTWTMCKRDLARSEFKMIFFCGVGDMQQPPGHNDVWVCTSRRGWLIDITGICWHSLNRISAVSVTIQR